MTAHRDHPTPNSTREYRHLIRFLNRVRRLKRLVVSGEHLIRGLLGLAAVAVVLFLLDNVTHFSEIWRWIALSAISATAVGVVLRAWIAAWSRLNHEQIALMVEHRFPQLENRLINSVQLSASEMRSPGAKLIDGIICETAQQLQRLNPRSAVEGRRLKRGLLAATVFIPLFLCYPLFSPDYFQNAVRRIMSPNARIQPLTRIRMLIEPGDVTVEKGGDLMVSAIPQRGLPRAVYLETKEQRGNNRFNMGLDGDRFVYSLREALETFRYRIIAGDFRSPWFKVTLIEKPGLTAMSVQYDYPSYTRRPPETIRPFDGHVAALTATRVTLAAQANKPLQTAELRLRRSAHPQIRINPADHSLLATFTIKAEDSYHWYLLDADGFDNDPAAIYNIRALADEDPVVFITSPRNTVEVRQGETLPILFRAQDDYGISRITVEMLRERSTHVLDRRDLDPPPPRVNDGYVLSTADLAVGDQVEITVRAIDTNPIVPGISISESLVIRIIPPPDPQLASTERNEKILEVLLRLLSVQIKLRDDLGKWRVSFKNNRVTVEQRGAIQRKILLGQSMLRADAVALVHDELTEPGWKRIGDGLEELTDGPMRRAVDFLRIMNETPETREKLEQSFDVHEVQTEIIRRIEELIGRFVEIHPHLKQTEAWERFEKERSERKRPVSLDDLMGGVEEFIGDQKGLLRSSQNWEDVHPDDLSTTMTREIEDLAAVEEAWAEYFKDAAEWLREAPMVKGTESGLRDELIEIYSEIESLPKEMRTKPFTLKVSEEESGVELAETLLEDLEKWLAEEPDFIKWVMENASEPYDVPLADLPDELEDIIGDLIETEEMMTEELEDITSNWADSMGQAGWGAMDGPISNYSAKGVTGNLLPNDMDIAGRAGEGRSGRSLGEMVESVATGKGGRQTPTRITGDPMGDGVVEDLSTEPVKGATGGGKLAGTTGWGLVAPNAPVQPELVERFASRQADLRMNALSLQERLMSIQMPTGSLSRSIEGMNKVEEALSEGYYDNLRDLTARVLSDLQDQREVVRERFRIRRDPGWKAQSKRRHEIRQVNPESFPEGYRALLSAYFEALASHEEP